MQKLITICSCGANKNVVHWKNVAPNGCAQHIKINKQMYICIEWINLNYNWNKNIIYFVYMRAHFAYYLFHMISQRVRSIRILWFCHAAVRSTIRMMGPQPPSLPSVLSSCRRHRRRHITKEWDEITLTMCVCAWWWKMEK